MSESSVVCLEVVLPLLFGVGSQGWGQRTAIYLVNAWANLLVIMSFGCLIFK